MSIKANLNKKLVLFIVDSGLFFLALFLALYIRRYDIFNFQYFVDHIPRFMSLYLVAVAAIFVSGLYDIPKFLIRVKKIKYIFYITLTYTVFGITFFYLMPSDFSPKTVLVIQAAIFFVTMFVWRMMSDNLLKNKKKIKAIILGSSADIDNLRTELFREDYGIEVVAHAEVSLFDSNRGPKDILLDTIKRHRIEIIIADLSDDKLVGLLPHIYTLSSIGVKLYDLKNIYQYVFKKMPLSSVGYYWFYENVSLDTRLYEIFKRGIDLLLCIPVFVVWAILHPWVVYSIRREDGGDVYSVQERLGRYNKNIKIKKYRTMTYTDKGVWQEESENKITKIGAFLRRARIDELPQILSVWRGDLSFVGPRTDIVDLGAKMASEIPFYNLRYYVTPGLSGWAQINMNYQPRGVADTTERLRYDLYYVKNRSMFLDLIIILRTIKTVLSREGS